jgi:two-component system, NarL family, response regulator LiaR
VFLAWVSAEIGLSNFSGVSMTEKIRILIVEDQEITRVGLRLTLENFQDFQVVGEASTGEEAVHAAGKLLPDIVLMDIGLEGIDGIEAAKLIKEQTPSIKVMMFTSHETDNDVFAALAAGADGYALKTIPSPQLALAIRTMIQGAGWLDPSIANRVLRACASVLPLTRKEQGTDKFNLSPREMEVLTLLVEGMSNQEIADKLTLSLDTIKTHMRHIMEKLCVSDRTQAAVKAMRQGLV